MEEIIPFLLGHGYRLLPDRAADGNAAPAPGAGGPDLAFFIPMASANSQAESSVATKMRQMVVRDFVVGNGDKCAAET